MAESREPMLVMGGDGWETRSEATISSQSFHDAPETANAQHEQQGSDAHQVDGCPADHPHSHPPHRQVPQASDTRYEAQQAPMAHAYPDEARYPPQNQGLDTEYQYGTARGRPRTPYPQVHDPQSRSIMGERRYGHAVSQSGVFTHPPAAAMPTAHKHTPLEASAGHSHSKMHRLQARSHYPESDDESFDGRMARPQYRAVKQERYRSRSRSPPKYNGKFDFLDFKVQFECFAEDNGWDYLTCGRKLSRCLTDSARSVLTSVDRNVRRDYATLCTALESLHLTPGGEGLRRTELHQASRKEGQCPSAFARELQRVATKAYPRGDLSETALVQLFTKGLRSTACERHVNLQAPQTLDAAVRHACAFEAYSPEESGCKKPKPNTQAVAKIATANPLQSQITQLSEKVEQLSQQLTKSQERG